MIGKKSAVLKWLIDQPDKEYEINEHFDKRSRTANSYYWVLLTKLSGALHTSNDELHEIMLQRYGKYLTDVDGNTITVTVRCGVDIRRFGGHYVYYKDNGQFAAYMVLKGSHDYDTKEMSELLDGLISECKECGIETLTPSQLEELRGYEKQTIKSV